MGVAAVAKGAEHGRSGLQLRFVGKAPVLKESAQPRINTVW